MDKVKTYEEELEEMEQFLEKDKEQKQKVESYTKKGFKIKKTSLITPPLTNEKIPVVEPKIAPSYSVPMEADTILRTPVAVKTLEDRAQERNERKHQEHLRQIAKEKIDELLRRKEAERKQSEEEERRKREERNLEQQAGESDDSYLRRLSKFYKSETEPDFRSKSHERYSPSSSQHHQRRGRSPKDERGRVKSSQKHSRFVDFMAVREKSTQQYDQHKPCGADRRVVLEEKDLSDKHKQCGADRRVVLEEQDTSDQHKQCGASRRVILVEGDGNQSTSKSQQSTSKRHQTEREAPLTTLPAYRRRRIAEYFERKQDGTYHKEREKSEPPVKRSKSSRRTLQEIKDAPETEEEYFRWRFDWEGSPIPFSREELFDTPYTKDFDREDEDAIDQRYKQWKSRSSLRPFMKPGRKPTPLSRPVC